METLDGGDEFVRSSDVAIGHSGSIERKAGVSVAIQKDEATGGLSTFAQEMDGFAGGKIG